MSPSVIGVSAAVIAVISVIGNLILWRKASSMSSELERISEQTGNLMQMEKYVLEKEPDYEDFERTISNLSERLFALVKDRYETEATTYEEMIDELEDMSDGDEIVDDLVSFFEYMEEMEYSDTELSEKDKALIRQAAFRLLRRAGPALEELEVQSQEE
jgi:DNA mismatch repair ATPase MutS